MPCIQTTKHVPLRKIQCENAVDCCSLQDAYKCQPTCPECEYCTIYDTGIIQVPAIPIIN